MRSAIDQRSVIVVPVSSERWLATVFVLALLVPIVAAGLTGVGIAAAWSLGGTLLLAAVSAPWLAARLPRDWDGLCRRHPLACAAWLLLAAVTVARSAGVAWFMADPQHPQASAFWFDEFYIRHNCASAYWKASELARAGVDNLYDFQHYAGFAGRFKLDEFLYIPQFLILPQVASALGADFQQTRAAWFALDALLLAGALVAVCHWLGGHVGRRALLLSPAVWVASPVLLTLQLGNFQLATVALAMLAMVLFERRRDAVGGALLAVAGFKLFPGLLGVYLLARRRWRAAGWTIAFSLLYAGLAWLWLGSEPFVAFWNYQGPRLLSGDAWAFLELEGLESVVAINDSVPALVLKLKVLGVDGMSRALMGAAGWVWTGVIAVLAVLAALRAPRMSRSELAASWLALLTLAAYRSPFVPDHNGLFSPLWLVVLLAASALPHGRRPPVRALLAWGVAWLLLGLVLPFGGMPLPGMPWRLLLSTSSQLLAVGLCLWVLLRQPAPVTAGEAGTTEPAAGASATGTTAATAVGADGAAPGKATAGPAVA